MKLQIEICLDNAAFDPHTGLEIGRILNELAKDMVLCGPLKECKLRDANGNTVGFAEIKED